MSASSLYASGLAAYRATSYETAVELFTQAIALDSTQAKFYDARAAAYEKLGQLKNGLVDCKEVVSKMPESFKGYLRGGRLWRMAGELERSEALLVAGLEKVANGDDKSKAGIETELALVRDLIAKASVRTSLPRRATKLTSPISFQYSPISRLPSEIFIDIIALACHTPQIFTEAPTPLLKPPRVNSLLSARAVCKTWHRTISTAPRLWDTLKIDGVLDSKRAVAKAVWWSRMATGQTVESRGAREDSELVQHTKGIRRIVITSAGSLSADKLVALFESLEREKSVGSLVEFTFSSIDGEPLRGRYTSSLGYQFLARNVSGSLRKLVYCIGLDQVTIEPPWKIWARFPGLEDFQVRVVGGGPVTRQSVGTGLPLPGPTPSRIPCKRLCIVGPVIHDLRRDVPGWSLPCLVDLEIRHVTDHILFWDLLSTHRLKKLHLQSLDAIGHLTQRAEAEGPDRAWNLNPIPDVANAWKEIEDLSLNGSDRWLIQRLLDLAVSSTLSFESLVKLDLRGASLSTPQLALFDSTNAPSLVHLDLSFTWCSTPHTSFVVPSLLSLRTLLASNNSWTNDDFVKSLIHKAPLLERLDLSGNPSITGRPLMEYVKFRMPEDSNAGEEKGQKTPSYSLLRTLKVEKCTAIETPAVEWLKKYVRPGGVKFLFFDPAEKGSKRTRLV